MKTGSEKGHPETILYSDLNFGAIVHVKKEEQGHGCSFSLSLSVLVASNQERENGGGGRGLVLRFQSSRGGASEQERMLQ